MRYHVFRQFSTLFSGKLWGFGGSRRSITWWWEAVADGRAVADDELWVQGARNLRVIDASVMPMRPSLIRGRKADATQRT